MEPTGPRLRTIESVLLRYMLDHPDAKDTAEGIMQWWLPASHGTLRAGELQAALEDLVRRGFVSASAVGPETSVYGLEKRRIDDIRAFLGG